MRVTVTGSAGHLGEALVRKFRGDGIEVRGLDLLESPFTTHVGSLVDADFVLHSTRGCDAIIHTATLHKPHVATHPKRAFVDTNVHGTLNVLEAAVENRVSATVFTSTTSAFGSVMSPAPGEPAVWVTEELHSVPKNIYGVTKTAAEDLCELFHRTKGLPVIVLRTSRFFPEADDRPQIREAYDDFNLKANEFLNRRLDIADAVDAHVLAMERAQEIGFARYVISATTPFTMDHLPRISRDAPAVVGELFPEFEGLYQELGWRMFPAIGRVYVNQKARDELGWQPRFDFGTVLDCLGRDEDFLSPISRTIGCKGYHSEVFSHGPYPVEDS